MADRDRARTLSSGIDAAGRLLAGARLSLKLISLRLRL
jgi:hypothetical protein